jgi:hypothetical protein
MKASLCQLQMIFACTLPLQSAAERNAPHCSSMCYTSCVAQGVPGHQCVPVAATNCMLPNRMYNELNLHMPHANSIHPTMGFAELHDLLPTWAMTSAGSAAGSGSCPTAAVATSCSPIAATPSTNSGPAIDTSLYSSSRRIASCSRGCKSTPATVMIDWYCCCGS